MPTFARGTFAAYLTFFFRTRQSLIHRPCFTKSEAATWLPQSHPPNVENHRLQRFGLPLRLKYQIGTVWEKTEMAESRGVAILVGAGDAIGAAVARRFAEGGYTVCICRRDAAKSQGLVGELRAAGHDIHAFSVDARQEAEIQGIFARIEKELGPIEVCLFNAGSNVNKPLLETTEKLFFKAWELACYGGFLVGREAARVMLPRGRGTIFFTGATASVRGGQGFAAFSSAKFGLRAVAQAMARELGPKNIHVVHLLIDAGVDSEAIHQRMKAAKGIEASEIPPDSLTKTSSIADAYWFTHQQSRDGWTHELDLRPSVEKW
jgi:NAD(P)-dependent dehydrogenase (short-subunit alcohol dehydrogenase family)